MSINSSIIKNKIKTIDDLFINGCCFYNDKGVFKKVKVSDEFKISKTTKIVLDKMLLEKIPEFINEFSYLKQLSLQFNHIKKIENLEELNALEILELDNNSIVKIEGLENCFNLTSLSITSNKINKIENLEKNKRRLRYLYLSNNKITKIEGLDKLVSMEKLYLANNKIKKIENLNNLNNLNFLDLEENIIKKIENLDKNIKLSGLKLELNKLKYSKYSENDFILNIGNSLIDDTDILGSEIEEYHENYLEKRDFILNKRKKLHQKIKNNNLKKEKELLKIKKNEFNSSNSNKDLGKSINFGF